MTAPFPSLRFSAKLRPSQRDAIEIARRQLDAGQHKLHIVAPPGSGKTVLGLWLWAECVRKPALVLSPNSAIQAQWAARVDLFDGAGRDARIVSTDTESPGLLTSLTYQAVTLPQRGTDSLDAQAIELWQEKLIEKGQAKDFDEAAVWIEDLKRHNLDYYDDRLSGYRKEIRDAAAIGGDAMAMLHASSLATLQRLKQRGIGLIILDECHHLLCHWGRVLSEVHEYFDHPIVLGLTATPPDRRGQKPEDIARYDEFFGPIDYEVPVPAVVKDGFLAPYQDLVQFVRPTADELAFIANADEQLHALVEELCANPWSAVARHSPPSIEANGMVGQPATMHEIATVQQREPMSATAIPERMEGCVEPQHSRESLTAWLLRVLAERRLPVGVAKDWESFEKRDEVFANAARWFLKARGIPLPDGVPLPPAVSSPTQAASATSLDMSVLVPVLDRYIRHWLRVSSDPVDHERAERAIARLRMLGVQVTETGTQVCASPVGRVLMYSRSKVAALIPILHAERRALGDRIRAVVVTDFEKTSAVTAEVSHLLDEEAGGAIAAFRSLLSDPETDELDPVLVTGSSVLVDDDLASRFGEAATAWLAAKGIDVRLTFAEEAGFHVLSGSGGDWCPRVYVAMITDLFQQGLTKCLVGTRGLLGEGWDATKVNVLVDLTTVTTSTSVNQLRGRSFRLDPDDPEKLADNWDVICLAPEFTKGFDDYQRFIDKHNTLFGLTDDGAVEKGVGHVHAAFTEIKPEGIEDSMPLLNAEMLERPQHRAAFRKLWRIGEPFHATPIHAVESQGGGGGGFPPYPHAKSPWSGESLAAAVSEAVLGALRDIGAIPRGEGALHIGTRSGGYVRAFLKDATTEASAIFSEALHEALGPLDNPRYVIPRYVDFLEDTWLSRILPRLVGQYFQRSHRAMQMLHAVPSAFAKNKDLALIYQRHWNAHVSPGEAAFAQRGEGERLVAKAVQSGTVPQSSMHRKEVFL
jgi:superfamily II DNA or RNA helicase